MTKSSIAYRMMNADETDLAKFKDCFDREGLPRPLEFFRWQYLQNPRDQVFVSFAEDPPETASVAAIYAVLPITAKVGDQRLLAAQSLDTLTAASHRGRGLFVKMAKDVYSRCEKEGCAFVYGFPNGSSAHGFFSRLDWVSLDPIPFLVRPLRVRYVARRAGLGRVFDKLPDIRLPIARPRLRDDQEFRVLGGFDEACDAIWHRFSAGVQVAVDRSAAYLNWRFRDKPRSAYRTLGLYERGRLLGFVVYVVTEKHGGRVGYVMELLHDPARTPEAVTLLNAALAEMARDRADVALAWCFKHSPNSRAFRRAGFLPFVEALRPIELHMGVRRLAAPANVPVGNRRSWYISYADSDTT